MEKERKSNLIIAGVTTVVIFVVACICFDFTYYLNDDCMLESIISGRFSGSPSAMTFYMSTVLAGFLTLFYRIIPGFSWLGTFFVLTILVCIFTLIYRAISLAKSKQTMLLVSISGIFAFIFSHLVMPHYTIVAALSCMTGIFWLATSDKPEGIKDATIKLIPSAVFMLLGYLIRSNVFYMAMVFFGMAALYILLKYGFVSIKSYAGIIGIFVMFFAIFIMADKMAYMSESYSEYKYYNQVRTNLYDYSYVGTEPEDIERYEEAGLSGLKVRIYKNYNLSLLMDESLSDMEVLLKNSPAAAARKGLKDVIYLYKEKLIKYKSEAVSSDFPMNYLVIVLYLIIMMCALLGKHIKDFIFVLALAAIRSGLWMYLIYMGRYPERITVSLFLLELALLFGILLGFIKDKTLRFSNAGVMLVTIMLLFAAYVGMQSLSVRYEEQIAVNGDDGVLYSYMEEKPGFYLLDTFSTVYRTTPVISVNGHYESYMLLGGWMSGHPLVDDKLGALGYEDVKMALLSDDVFFVAKDAVGNSPEDVAAVIGCQYRIESVLDNRFYIYKFY